MIQKICRVIKLIFTYAGLETIIKLLYGTIAALTAPMVLYATQNLIDSISLTVSKNGNTGGRILGCCTILWVALVISSLTWAIFQGSISLGIFVALAGSAGTVLSTTESLSFRLSNVARKCYEIDYYDAFLKMEEACFGDSALEDTAVQDESKKDVIELRNVYFKYGEASDYVLKTMNIPEYGCGILTEQFLDRNGRTILSRRFNRDDWAMERYGKRWTELLPENERLTVNGETYAHWYDCITDYIL